MNIIQIHADFRLNGYSFKDASVLLDFVKEQLPTHFSFLKDLLHLSTTIQVKTSGSTGKPKSITLSKKAMLASAEATGFFFDLKPKTKALHCLSSDFIAGKMMWVRALHLGWHIQVKEPSQKPLLVEDESYDFAAMVPLQVENSLEYITQIKKLIVGGAALSYSLEQKLIDLPIDVYQTYGMTETITHIAARKVAKEKQHYKALPDVTFSVDDRNCLLIEAPRINKEKLITNDIVQLHNTFEFEWLGRYDNVVNSGGIKLFPEQIEQKLSPYIDFPFFISAFPDNKFGEKLILVIESSLSIKDIATILEKASLTKYEIPKEIFFLPHFIYTDSQKINRLKTIESL